jgi:hypothetical protein
LEIFLLLVIYFWLGTFLWSEISLSQENLCECHPTREEKYACVCVREKERMKEKERDRGREGGREGGRGEREREREREGEREREPVYWRKAKKRRNLK